MPKITRRVDDRNLVRSLSENRFDVLELTLGQRKKPVLASAMDTHEVVYELPGQWRVVPVLELSALFPKAKKAG